MIALQRAGMGHPAGMRDCAHLGAHLLHEIFHAHRFFFRVQTALQMPVVRGNAGGAGVLIALQRLDAAKREHKAARGVHGVGAGAVGPGHLGGRDELAGRDHLDPLAQIVAA